MPGITYDIGESCRNPPLSQQHKNQCFKTRKSLDTTRDLTFSTTGNVLITLTLRRVRETILAFI